MLGDKETGPTTRDTSEDTGIPETPMGMFCQNTCQLTVCFTCHFRDLRYFNESFPCFQTSSITPIISGNAKNQTDGNANYRAQ